jgi:hypothetical protein
MFTSHTLLDAIWDLHQTYTSRTHITTSQSSRWSRISMDATCENQGDVPATSLPIPSRRRGSGLPRLFFLVKPNMIVLQDNGSVLLMGNIIVNIYHGSVVASPRCSAPSSVRRGFLRLCLHVTHPSHLVPCSGSSSSTSAKSVLSSLIFLSLGLL